MELKGMFLILFICLIGFLLEFVLRFIFSKINPELLNSIDEPDELSSDAWLDWYNKQENNKN